MPLLEWREHRRKESSTAYPRPPKSFGAAFPVGLNEESLFFAVFSFLLTQRQGKEGQGKLPARIVMSR